MYKSVHRSFIHNSPKVETTQMSVSSRMERKIVVYSHSRTLRGKNEEGATCGRISQTVLRGRSRMEACTLQHFTYMKFKKTQNLVSKVRIVVTSRGRSGY